MWQFLKLGSLTSLLTSASGIIYEEIYTRFLGVDFSVFINTGSIIGVSFFTGFFFSCIYYFWHKRFGFSKDVLFNALFLTVIFLSLIISFGATLPTEIKKPEMFVGLSVPLHIMLPLFWLASKPIFYK